MAQIELLDDRLVTRTDGWRRLLTIIGEVTVRYEAIEHVDVGLDELPGWSTWRVGYNPAVGSRRAGIFWWRGRKWFMDVNDPDRSLVLRLKPGAGYDAVAVTVDHPESLAAEIRRRLASERTPPSGRAMAAVQGGFDAWRRGDFEHVEALLDPAAEWYAPEPGEWDCHGREDVMRTLRERYDQGFNRVVMRFLEAGEGAVIIVSHPAAVGGADWPEEIATLISLRDGRVFRMQDYRTEAEAVAAAGAT
jgi:ketosteroid isomerase-like protein